MTPEEFESLVKSAFDPEMLQVRSEVATEVTNGVLKTVNDVMAVHGHDPLNVSIVAAGMARAIRTLGKINPDIEITIALLLSQ